MAFSTKGNSKKGKNTESISFEEWVRSGQTNTQTNTQTSVKEKAKNTKATTSGNSKNSSKATSFEEWVRNEKSGANTTSWDSIQTWGEDANNFLEETRAYFGSWHGGTEAEDAYRSYQDRASKILAVADDWRKQYAGNSEVISYIDSVVSAISDSKSRFMNYRDYYSMWGTEDEYNSYVEAYGKEQDRKQTYAGKSSDELWDIIGGMNAGEEKDWVTNYAYSVMTAEDYDKLIAQKEAEHEALVAEWDRVAYENGYSANDAEYREYVGKINASEIEIDNLKRRRYFAEKETQYGGLKNNEDYSEYSTQVSDDPTSKLRIGSWDVIGDLTYDYINDIDGTREKQNYSGEGNARGNVDLYKYSFMTRGEIAQYNYIYNTEGKKAANEYLEYLTYDLDARRKQELAGRNAEFATEHPFWSSVYSVPVNLVSGIGLIDNIGQNVVQGARERITGEYKPVNYNSNAMNPTVTSSTIRGTVAQNLANDYGVIEINEEEHPFWGKVLNGKSFGDVYQLGMSMVDSTAIAAMSPLVGSFGTVLLGGAAGSQGVLDAVSRGATDKQAMLMGIFNGTFEALFEKVSLDNLIKGGARNAVMAFFQQGFIEGTEEFSTSVANNIADILIMAEKSDYKSNIAAYMDQGLSLEEAKKAAFKDAAIQIAWDYFGGVISGGLMGGVGGSARNFVAEQKATTQQGRDIVSSGQYDSLQALAYDVASEGIVGNAESRLKRTTDAVTQKVESSGETISGRTARSVVKLADRVDSVRTSQNIAEIQTELQNKGMSKSDAKAAARILNNAVETKEFSRRDFKKVMGDEAVYDALRSMVSNPESSVNKRNLKHGLAKLGIKVSESNGIDFTDEIASIEDSLSSEEKNAYRAALKASDTGTAVLIDTDEEVSIKEIASIKDGKMTLKLEDGRTVDASEISYSSQSEALVYESVASMGINAIAANEIVKAYDSSISAMAYVRGVEEAFRYGTYNIPMQEMSERGAFSADLTDYQRTVAYRIGQKLGGKTVAQAQRSVENKKSTTSEKKAGSTEYDGDVSQLNDKQRVGYETAKMLSKALGNKVYFYESYLNENGERVYKDANGNEVEAPNGWYDPKDGSIHLDINAGNDGTGTVLFTLSHELTHFIKQWSPRKFKVLANFLFEQMGENGTSVEGLIQKKMKKLGLSYDAAYEEVVADSMETILSSGNVVETFAELKKQDRTLWEKIVDFFKDIVQKLKDIVNTYGNVRPDSVEGNIVADMKGVISQLEQIFAEGLYEASENFQNADGIAFEGNGVTVAENGTIMLQQRHYRETGRNTLLDYLTEQYGKNNASDLISTIDEIYNVMNEIREENPNLKIFSQWQETEIELDDNGKPIFTTSINNGDYTLNQDFSRVCKKRRQLDFVLNLLAEDPSFEAKYLTKDSFVKINNAIKEHGFEIACALCFVDAKRFRQAEWADSFANTWNDILESVVADKSKLTPFNFATNSPNINDNGIEINGSTEVAYRKWSDGKATETRKYASLDEIIEGKKADGKYIEGNSNVRTIARIIRDNPNLRHTFRGADIIASQGFDSIQRLAPNIRNILDGWGGSSVPKPSSSDASYDSSILNISGYNKETAYAMGGARMNSFSDFMAHMFFDYCEAFADLSAKQLPMQAYTKELVFARLFGTLGGKINLSGIAAIRENALPTKEKKGVVTKAEAEANREIEKRFAGLDVARIAEHLDVDVKDLTESDIEQFLHMADYVWADESINMKKAILLQTGIMYDRLSETQQELCYELIKEGKISEAHKKAGKSNVNKEYAKNIGTIVVGVSDAHIRKLLRDSTVRMVIPYHKSGLNPTIAQLMKIDVFNDYTDIQNTGFVKKNGSRSNLSSKEIKDAYGLKDFSFYDYFGKTIDGVLYDGRAVAEKYLEWCEKGVYDESVGDYVYYTTKGKGYILAKDLHKKGKISPKFEKFSDEINYYKCLEDFDCYDTITEEHSAQGAVQMLSKGLPSDYKKVITEALKDEQRIQDDFRDHLDNQGLKEEILGIVSKNGYDIKKSTRSVSKEQATREAIKESNTVEGSPDLVAFHNTTLKLLTDILNRNGLLMPSLAITNKSMTDFGEISLLFDKSTIDPTSNKDNKLYGADAWTPTQTELKKNAKFDAAKTNATVNNIKKNLDGYASELFNITPAQFKVAINKADGSVYDAYAHNIGMQTAYAMEHGIIAEIPTNRDGTVNTELLHDSLKDNLNTDNGWRLYKRWLSRISDTIITSYDKATNADILRNMKAQPATAKNFELSETGELVVPAVEYRSIDEVRQNKGRLSENAADATKAVADKFLALAKKMPANTKSAVNAINKGFASRYSVADIVRSFAKQGIDISTETASELQNLYKDAVELPTQYFEAKPSGQIGIDQIRYAVMPDNTAYDWVKGELEKAGVTVISYTEGSNESRVNAVKSADDIKFQQREAQDDFREHLDNQGLRDEILGIVNQNGYEAQNTDASRNPYEGKSLYRDSEVYDYDFMVSLQDMEVNTMPPLSTVKTDNRIDQDKAVRLGLENAASVGREVSEGMYAIKNAYTGREILLGAHGLDHGLDGSNIGRLRTNARLAAIGGLIVKNAIPVNGMKNKNRQAKGTYAMACLLKSGDMDVVAIVTVEEHTSKAVGIDYVDITHAIGGRLRQNNKGSLSSTREKGYGQKSAPNAATFEITIADFLEVVNDTHRSILSQNVLDHFGEVRPADGTYTGEVLFSMREAQNVFDDAVSGIEVAYGSESADVISEMTTDVMNTLKFSKRDSVHRDETYSMIGKELLTYEEGDLPPDLTLVETVNERTGLTETTIKHFGQKPKNYVPKKIAYCYKLFEQHPDGTLHALFAGATKETPVGVWQYAQGFPYTDAGVKGMNLRERYGWHLSAGLPSAPHLMSPKDFGRGYPSKKAYGHPANSKRVWVRMAYDASTDFNSVADSTRKGDIFGLIPFGGYYAFKENNQSEWVISSGVKIDKILTEEERQQILKEAGYDEYEAWRKKHRATDEEKAANKRKAVENKKAKDKAVKEGLNYLSESSKAMRDAIKSRIIDNPELKYSMRDSEGKQLSVEQQEYFKDSKVRDADGNLLVAYHVTPSDTFYEFDSSKHNSNSGSDVWGKGFYFSDEKASYYWSGELGGRNELICYLDIKKPFIASVGAKVPQDFKDYVMATDAYKGSSQRSKDFLGDSLHRWYNFYQFNVSRDVNAVLQQLGYDGIIVGDNFEIIIFNSNQAKLTTNTSPTTVPDIRYQMRETESMSNRSLLANAFNSVIQDDIERNKLEEYKSQIEALDAEERKLRDLKNQIKDISFAKGKRDTAKLKKLQAEATKTANRISTYDKILLRLEAAKPLQDVLERERQKSYKKAKAEGRKALEEYRTRTTTTRNKAEVKAKIKRVVSELDRYLRNGTKDKHVPIALQNVVAEALDIITEDAGGVEMRIAQLNELIAKATDPDVIEMLTEDRDRLQRQADKLNKRKRDYADIKRANNSRFTDPYKDFLSLDADTAVAEERLTEHNERIAELDELIAKATDPDIVDMLTKKRNRIQAQGNRLVENLEKLKSAYDKLEGSNDVLVSYSYDKVISNKIDAVVEAIGNTTLRDMNTSQLEEVYDLYKMILTTIRNANKSFKAAKSESIAVLGSRVMDEINKQGKSSPFAVKALRGIKQFGWNGLKPVYAFKAIGSQTLSDAFDAVRAGEDTWARDVVEAREYYLETSKKYKYDSWDMEKQYSFKSRAGVDFSLSLEQIMSLYAYSKREQADEHLEVGGFVFDDAIEVTEKKHGVPIKYTVKTATAHNLSRESLGEIISTLTQEQKGFVDEMQEYLSSVMGEKGNEITLQMYGVKLFGEKNYFPLKSAKQFLREENTVAGEVKLKNSGFTKKTKPHASNPIILSNFMDAWSKHVNDMSMYHGFVLPLEDFNRIFNYQKRAEGLSQPESVKSSLQNAFDTQPEQYIKQLLVDLNGGARTDSTAGIINKMTGLFKKGAVFASASVVIQQPSAIARALAYIDAKYFVGRKFDNKRHNALWAEVKEYAPVAIIKEMGYFDTNVGQSTTDWITAKEYSGVKEKMVALVKDSGYRDEVLSKAPALADEIAWCAIWEAVKRETAAKRTDLKVGSEEFLQAAGKRFTEVVVNTQVYDSVLSKSAMMRSKDTGMKMLTAFMAEPTTSINMVFDALVQGKRGNKKFARNAIGAVVAAQIFNSFLVSFVYAARDDDDDETYVEKYLESFIGKALDSLNPLTYIPILKDMVSIAQGYDVERSDMSIISDIYNAYKKLGNENVSVYRKVEDFAGSIAQLFGLPVRNIMRDVRGIYQMVDSFIDGEPMTGAGVKYAAKSALPKVVGGGDTSNGQQLYEAMLNDDEAHAARVRGRFKDQSAVDSAIRKALRDNDPRIHEAAVARMNGNLAEYTRLAKEIIAEGHFKQDYVVGAINNEITALSSDNSSTSSTPKAVGFYTTDEFADAVAGGDAAMANAIKSDIIQTKQKNGKTKEEAEEYFEQYAKSACKEMFIEGGLSESKAVKALVTYIGMDQDDAEKAVGEWAFEKDYGFTYSDRGDAYKSGKISAYELREILIDVGGKTPEEADLQIQVYDWQMEVPNVTNITVSAIEDYNDYCEPVGISKGDYYEAWVNYNDTDADYDADGDPIRNSKTQKVMYYIDGLALTNDQKTALALCWYSASTVQKYKLW